MNKRQRIKLERASQTFGKGSWILDDFHKNLKLSNVGVDPRNAHKMVGSQSQMNI
jgi:hypothetical protein